MAKFNLKVFVEKYSEKDEQFIRLKSNGLQGQYFIDGNNPFREEVIGVVLNNPKSVPSILFRDLFRALTKSAAQSWSLDPRANTLANAMMTSGGTAFLDDFIIGWLRSFDTYMGINLEDCPMSLLRDCLAEIERILGRTEGESTESYEDAKEVFNEWISDKMEKESRVLKESSSYSLLHNQEGVISKSLRSIRNDPGMYIPRIGTGKHPDDGIYVVFKEIVDNAVDEFIQGSTQQIDICLSKERGVMVRDYGRGLPPGRIIDCFTQINAGATYSTDLAIFSLGLSGIGGKVVNALSEYFKVTVFRGSRFYAAIFRKGVLVSQDQGETDETDGACVEFLPDNEIFPDFSFNEEFLENRLRYYSFLRPGLTLRLGINIFHSRNGLLDLFHYEFAKDELYPPIHYMDETLEFIFAHTNKPKENILSFVNGSQTKRGGTHVSVFKKGILHGINRYFGKNFQDTGFIARICGAISIKILDPQFDENKRQDKLCSKEVSHCFAEKIQNGVYSALKDTPDTAEKLLEIIGASGNVAEKRK